AGEAGQKNIAGLQVKSEDDKPKKEPLRMLEVADSDLASGNVSAFIRIFSRTSFTERENARILRGNCLVTFPLESDPRPVVKIPSARAFTKRLHQNVPHFPYFLCPAPELSAMFCYFGCLVPEHCINAEGGIDLRDPEFLEVLIPCLESIKSFALEMKDDPSVSLNNVLSFYPEDMRSGILELMD
ncbi:MAG TPA: hypothetical protein VLE43_18795, partial [Candidatus Saccharimonadia bacterium]|nr:hypothetical protein [Candidatus Saccharimonadia bacterium]